MALTYTPAGELGSSCPDFKLPSVDQKSYSLNDFKKSEVLVVMFICNHCPYVKAIEDRMLALAHDFKNKNVSFVGICSNDPSDHPEDQPEELFKRWREKNYDFPYLIDAKQVVAHAFGAVCTPDLYVFNADKKLAYRGRLDDSWRNPAKVQKQELRDAIEALLAKRAVAQPQNPAMGCSIKWSDLG